MKAAAAYVRASKDALRLGLSIERQRELVPGIAAEHGWPLRETYEDNDISAYRGNARPGFLALVEAVRAGRIDAIVCVDADRITREMREGEDVIDLGVPLALRDGVIDLTTAAGQHHLRGQVAQAAFESSRKSERLKREKADARKRGWWVGRPPYGYRTVDSGDGFGRKRLEAVPDEAKRVREMARRVLDGETLHAVARWAGAGWHPLRVKRALSRPAMVGWQPHKGRVFRHPDTGLPVPVVLGEPVLDEVTWQRLQNALSGRKRAGLGDRVAEALLARLVECDACQHTMSWSSGGSKGRPRYVCRTSFERGGGCPGNTVAGLPVHALVDDYVAERLKQLATDGLAGELVQVDAETAAEVSRLGVLLGSQESERRRLLLDGATPERIAAVQGTIDEIDTRLQEAQSRLEASRKHADLSRLEGLIKHKDPAAEYRGMDVPSRRRVAAVLIERVRIIPGPKDADGKWKRTSVFDPARVEIDPVA